MALLGVLLLTGSLQAAPFDSSKLQGLGDTRYLPFNSEQLGHPLHIYVRVPESAAEHPDQRYPTLYLLDGGITFPMLSAYYHYLRLGEELPELLIVGISYGSDRFAQGNYRASDFTAPSDEVDYWGGAPIFQQVLADELLPLIEKDFPSDPQRRMLFGHSLGGQFVLYSALTRPQLFKGHLVSNPALHNNLEFFLAWQGEQNMPADASRLYVSIAELDRPELKEPAVAWAGHWSAPERPRPFVLKVDTPAGESHLSSGPEAFRQGLLWLLQDRP